MVDAAVDDIQASFDQVKNINALTLSRHGATALHERYLFRGPRRATHQPSVKE